MKFTDSVRIVVATDGELYGRSIRERWKFHFRGDGVDMDVEVYPEEGSKKLLTEDVDADDVPDDVMERRDELLEEAL